MSDLISRQDAIEAIRKSVSKSETEDSLCYNLGLGVAEEVVNSLPSAEPKTGEWVRKDDELFFWYECSECGNKPMANRFSYREERSAFCPHCGARMLGEDGEA